jgi:hypothetical protein
MKVPYPQVTGNQGMVFLGKYVISSNNGYFFYCIGTSFLWLYGNGNSYSYCQDNSFPTDSAWHNVVGTSDNTGTKLYIDGVKITSANWNGSPGTTNQTAHFSIGIQGNPIIPQGIVDDIRIYNRVLTDTEIQALANDK